MSVRHSSVAPSGEERTFGSDEIIVSKTDARGIIRYANEVFIRVAAYPEAELIGKPHNVIRHPDMPRCVFALLWETIQRGDELFAYIVNLAADGAHYWVLAHVTPSYDASGSIAGYHSNRRLPERDAIAEISELYAELRAAEARHQHPKAATEAGAERLREMLERQGQTYEQYVWALTSRSLEAV